MESFLKRAIEGHAPPLGDSFGFRSPSKLHPLDGAVRASWETTQAIRRTGGCKPYYGAPAAGFTRHRFQRAADEIARPRSITSYSVRMRLPALLISRDGATMTRNEETTWL